ncbi:MAG TPA: hypothetical protein VM327_07415 [Candidatus Thermoplasmatota archaeon]|nr:hypothetical protein [Candidatus Thermoplasmatota archaeon]
MLHVTDLLLASLLLHPALSDDGHLRLVAIGTDGETVEWSLDGAVVAHTGDGEAAVVSASSGEHELWATSAAEGRWRALARPDDRPAAGAEVVPAWTTEHEPVDAAASRPGWLLPAGAALGSAAVMVRPVRMKKTGAALRSLLQALRRPRRP